MSTRLSERQRQRDDTEEFLRILYATPLRSIEDIREEREPIVSQPVTAVGMQHEQLERPEDLDRYRGIHRRPYRGPSPWRLGGWFLWHFGDLVHWRRLYEHQHNSYRVV